MHRHTLNRPIVLSFTLGLFALQSGCSSGFAPEANSVASSIESNLGCKATEEAIWDALREASEIDGQLPSPKTAAQSIQSKLGSSSKSKDRELSKLQIQALADTTAELIEIAQLSSSKLKASLIAKSNGTRIQSSDRARTLQVLAELEIGDRTTPEKAAQHDRVRATMAKMKASLGSVPQLSTCVAPVPTQPEPTIGPLLDEMKRSLSRPVYGAAKTLAVLYQSCDALQEPVLDARTPNAVGLKIIGEHPSGSGFQRVIADRETYLKTHPYLARYRTPSTKDCFSVLEKPSIYDFGGKPATTSRNELLYDLFTNSGSGTEELGIDCSAFVVAAYTSAGLKIKKETSLKASLVHGVSSSMIYDPARNGLSCLTRARYENGSQLLPGDLVAIRGHVFMVESVGPDPLAINRITKPQDCTAQNIRASDFDFTLVQSSPTKGAIGVHRIEAKDYLATQSTYRNGLIEHAIQACRSRFGPPASKEAVFAGVSVVRHLNTPECVTDSGIQFTRQSCLSTCSGSRMPAGLK